MMMDERRLEAYLERIGLVCAPAPDAKGLAELQRAHLETVPFENLDIVTGRVPLPLDEDSLFDKIVKRRRGGICYELNLLFAAALRALGYDVQLRSGRHPKYGDDMDHLFTVVKVPDDDVARIADVGFAYNFATPLRLEPGTPQDDGRDRYRIEVARDIGPDYLRIVRTFGLSGAGEELELYGFSAEERTPSDCRSRCDWYCTSPQSRFTQGPLVCIDGHDCRRTLSANHLVTTAGATRTVRDIATAAEYEACLHELFGL